MTSVTVVIEGPLDFATAGEHVERLSAATSGGDVAVVVDLEGCDFLDSAGLALLLRCAHRARSRGGALHLRSPSRAVRRLLELACLDGELPSLPVVAAA